MNHSLHNWRHLMHSPCTLFAYRYVYLTVRGWDSISDCLFISFWLLRLIKFACEGNAWLPSTIEDCVGMRMRNRGVRAFLPTSLWTPHDNGEGLAAMRSFQSRHVTINITSFESFYPRLQLYIKIYDIDSTNTGKDNLFIFIVGKVMIF